MLDSLRLKKDENLKKKKKKKLLHAIVKSETALAGFLGKVEKSKFKV